MLHVVAIVDAEYAELYFYFGQSYLAVLLRYFCLSLFLLCFLLDFPYTVRPNKKETRFIS